MPIPVTHNSPGSWGVNEQEKNQLLHPNWATVADGLVLSTARQLATRGGLTLVSTDNATAEILRQFVYVDSTGTETVISAIATKIISGVGDLDDASTDITPTGTPTNGYWQFQNFNGKVVGWQASHTPIYWSGSGDFAVITASTGTLPDGDCVCSAFGRLWAVDDDGQTVRYCALLDETKWAAADGGGSIDMRNVWTQGMDRVTAIAAFGSNLVIFGRKHIIFYTDGQGSPLGLDPTQMYVVDTVEGTGCISRDSVAHIGNGDLVFLSTAGLQSLSRVIQNKDNPLSAVSWQIADRIQAAIATEVVSATDLRTWAGTYIPKLRQYMLVHTTNEDVFVFHCDDPVQDEKGRSLMPITIWDTSILTNIRFFTVKRDGTVYTTGGSNDIYSYTTVAVDQGSTAVATQFDSGWIDFDGDSGQHPDKLLKIAQLTVLNPSGRDSIITFRYAADYSTTIDSVTANTSSLSRIVNLYDPTGDIEGQYFKIGFSDPDAGGKSYQQFVLHFKTGRTAFIHKKFGVADTDVNGVDGSGIVSAASGPRLLNPDAAPITVSVDAAATSVSFSAPAPSEALTTAGGLILLMVISGAPVIGPDGSAITYGGVLCNPSGFSAINVASGDASWNAFVANGHWSTIPANDTLSFPITPYGSARTVKFLVYFFESLTSAQFDGFTDAKASATVLSDTTPSQSNTAAISASAIVAMAAARNDFLPSSQRDIALLSPTPDFTASLDVDTTFGAMIAFKQDTAAYAIGAFTANFEMTNPLSGRCGITLVYSSS